MTARIDELRAAFPALGFAIYAMEPKGPVTFEVYDGSEVFTFKALTEEAAIEKAFPTAVAADPPLSKPITKPSILD